MELNLGFASAEPVVLHVHGFCLALNDGVVTYTHGSRIIALDGGLRLQPIHFDEGIPKQDHGLGIDEQACYFGFGSRGHNKLDDLGDSKDWYVAGGVRRVFRKNDVRTSAASSLADIEVCGIRVSCKDHATSAEEDYIVGVSGDVIQELEQGRVGVFGGVSLLLVNIVETDKELVVTI